jgi:hypothetical protein
MILSTLLLRSQSPTGLFIWCGAGVCAGVYLFIQGFRLLQRRHLILDTPFSKIRSAPLGLIELSGLAMGPYTMVAPITARPCYYYRTLVWEWKQSGKNKQWVKVAAECMHVPFFLDDNTGKVMVDPRRADLDLHRDFEQQFCDSLFTTKEAAPDNVRGFLSRHGISTTNKIKVEEFCIKPKNALFLLGTLDENPGLELTPKPIRDEDVSSLLAGNPFSFSLGATALFGGNGDEHSSLSESMTMPPVARELATPHSTEVIRLSTDSGPTKAAEMTQQQKIAAALLKAGISSPAAWAAAGVTPSDVAVNPGPNGVPPVSLPLRDMGASAPTPDGFDPHPPVVLMKGKNNPTFLISWRSQRDLARSLAWKCTLMIWGGPALALLSLYALLKLMHWF